jgi:DNA-binding LacI/PurR family transcriptional regulator
MLLDGRLKPGSRLPSEQDLASRFTVARTTVRSVLEQLEREHLIQPSRGRGSRRLVSTALDTPEGSILAETVIILNDGPTADEEPRTFGRESSVHGSVLEELARANRHALSLQASRLSEEQIRRLCADRPCGVVALNAAVRSPKGRAALGLLRENGIPIVAYGDSAEVPGSDAVVSDHAQGSFEVTRWLLQRGRRRILPVWQLDTEDFDQQPRWLAQRLAGYERAMREADAEPLPPLVYRQLTLWPIDTAERFEQHARLATGYLVEYLHRAKAIDALLAVSDQVAFFVSAALRRLGLEPHKEVLVAGYDNSWRDWPLNDYESTGPRATVDKRNDQIGAELAHVLADRLSGKFDEAPYTRRVAPTLVEVDLQTAPDRGERR